MQGSLQAKKLEIAPKTIARRFVPVYFGNHLICTFNKGEIFMRSSSKAFLLISTFVLLNISDIKAYENQKNSPILLLPLDPQLQHFAAQVQQAYPAPLTQFEINVNILKAALIFDVLGAAGIRYEQSSNKSDFFAHLVKEDTLYLNAPLDLFHEHKGSAEELAILYAAILEVNGIPTALLNASGHPLVAFDTGIHRKYSGVLSRDITSYLTRNYHVWMPVETALLGKPFHKAWEAAQKRMNAKIFDLWPVRDYTSDLAYETIAIPSKEKIDELYSMDKNYFENDKTETKLSKVTEIMRENRSRSVTHLNIGISHLNSGKYEEAISEFNKAIQAGGDVEKALFLTAKALSEKKEYGTMLEIGRKLLQLNSRNPRGLKVIGSANFFLGKITEGEEYFKQAKFLEENLLQDYSPELHLDTQKAEK